jgi:hypothetical protein
MKNRLPEWGADTLTQQLARAALVQSVLLAIERVPSRQGLMGGAETRN